MKTYILFSLALVLSYFIIDSLNAQDSLYLGETPPGSTPQLFGDNLMLENSAYIGHRLAISIDGKEIYFSRRNSFNDPQIIQFLKYEDNKWNGPYVLFSGFPYDQTAPAFSVDGKTLYFHSIENNKIFAYFIERASGGWTEPQLYKEYTKEIFYFQETNNNNFYATTNYATNGIGGSDICKIIFNEDTISEVKSLGAPLNTEGSGENSFYIAKDESFIVLGRNEDFSAANRDLYISYKKADNTWTNPKSLGTKINSGSTLKWGPYVTSDNMYLFYESDDIRWTTWWVRFDNLLDSLKYTNFSPYVKYNIPDQEGTIGHLFSYTLPDTIFYDDDGNNTLTFSVSLSNGDPLPENLIDFNPSTRTFSGTPDTTGIFEIKVTATDTAGEYVSVQFNLTVVDPSTSMNQIYNQKIFIYPNPSNGLFTLSFGGTINQEAKAKIYNVEGKLVYNKTFHRIANALINLQGYPQGIYILKVTHNGIIYKYSLYKQM